jgi:hypothetical protein
LDGEREPPLALVDQLVLEQEAEEAVERGALLAHRERRPLPCELALVGGELVERQPLGADRGAVAVAQPADEAATGRAVGGPGRVALERSAEDLDQLGGRRDEFAGDRALPRQRLSRAGQDSSLPANDSCDAGGGL